MNHKKVVLIIAFHGYQPVEYGHTRTELERAGIHIDIASDSTGTAHVSEANLHSDDPHAQYSSAHIDLAVADIDPARYDGIIIIGGPGALEHLDNEQTYSIVQKAAKLGTVLGAICVAPRIFAHAGLLSGKMATGWDGDGKLDTVFKQHDVKRVLGHVVTDGNIVTADGPHAATDFGKTLVKVLG